MESPTGTDRWTLNRIVALFLAAGFFFLLVETRMEHDHLLAKEPLAYIPFVFSLCVFLVALAAAFRWKPGMVKLLLVSSLLAVVVGFGGLWFHNEDRIEGREETELRSGEARRTVPEQAGRGEQRPGDESPVRGERRPAPPMLAPAAFVGMGLLGTLIALRRWPGDVA